MVSPVALLLLNLIHIIVGTFGLVFLILIFASVQELTATTKPELTDARNYLAASVGLAAAAWGLAITTGAMGAPAAQDGLHYQVRVVSGLSFVSFVLYAVAGALAVLAYPAYPDALLAGAAALLFVAAVLVLAYGSCGVILGRAPVVVVLETAPPAAAVEAGPTSIQSLNPLVYPA